MGKAVRTLLMVVLLGATSVACQSRPALSFAPEILPNGTVGQPYSAVIAITGNETPVGDISTADALPPGLTLVYGNRGDSSAQLIGTPTLAGSYPLTISAWCLGTNVSGQTGSHQYTVVVHG